MNIYAKPGTPVRFTNENGYDRERKAAAEILRTDFVYHVDYTKVYDWRTTVYLKEIKQGFNSVMFEEVEEENVEGKRATASEVSHESQSSR